jgi:hypothetical protein
MTPLSDALTAAQRSALAALEKAYVAGQIEAPDARERLDDCGISDPVDIAFLFSALDVLREWGVSAPTMTERRLTLYVVGVCPRCDFDLTGEDPERDEREALLRSYAMPVRPVSPSERTKPC